MQLLLHWLQPQPDTWPNPSPVDVLSVCAHVVLLVLVQTRVLVVVHVSVSIGNLVSSPLIQHIAHAHVHNISKCCKERKESKLKVKTKEREASELQSIFLSSFPPRLFPSFPPSFLASLLLFTSLFPPTCSSFSAAERTNDSCSSSFFHASSSSLVQRSSIY